MSQSREPLRAGARPLGRRPIFLVATVVAGIGVLAVVIQLTAQRLPAPSPASRGSLGSTVTGPAGASGTPSGGSTGLAAPTAGPASGSVTTGSAAPSSAPSSPPAAGGPFPGSLLIADRGNGRLLVVNSAGRVLWHFPVAGSLPKGQGFSADDAFISPDGKTISANEEQRQVVVRIDIASRRIIWEYGHYGQLGSAPGYLNTPNDAYPLANGDTVIADIFNCRVIEVSPAKVIVRQWGHTRVCRDRPPFDYGEPNGDTPLPDGGLLITEIRGSRVVRLDAAGHVVFDIHVPTVYPSDAQLDPTGNVVVSDYSNPGAVVAVSPAGKLLWRYGPRSGLGRLDHPSLAVPRPDGTVLLNDDFRHRVVLIDPRTGRILWQYGTTDRPGRGANQLFIPDGVDEIPAGLVAGL